VGALVFLSDVWIAALDAALRASVEPADREGFVLEQVVFDVPSRGTVRYCLAIDGDGARVTRDAEPDLRLTTDYATAVAIARGTTNAQSALAAGRLRIGGSMELFAARADALLVLGDIAARVRADTEYDEP
jgi:putative sterol carrier protein